MTCNKEWRKKYGYVDLIPSEEGRKLPSGNWHFEHSSVLDQLKHFLTKLTYEIYLASHSFYTLWCIRHQYAPCDCSSLITSSYVYIPPTNADLLVWKCSLSFVQHGAQFLKYLLFFRVELLQASVLKQWYLDIFWNVRLMFFFLQINISARVIMGGSTKRQYTFSSTF